MDVLQFWKQINNKKMASVYLLIGTEAYLMEQTVKKLVEAALQEDEKDFNFSVYDMEEIPVETAMEDAETLPFMGEKRVVLLKNPIFLTGEKKKEKIDHNIERFEQYIKEPAPYTVLIVQAPYEKLDERKKISKLLKKTAVVGEARPLSEQELIQWTHTLAKLEDTEMEQDASEHLVALTNGSLMLMDQEILKLSAYIGPGGRISRSLVDQLTARTLEQNIFELINHVTARKADQALHVLHDLLKANEEPIKILSLISAQIRLILQVKQLAAGGYGQPQIASTLKVHPFRVKLAAQQAASFSEEELKSLIKKLAEADYGMKTGRMDKVLILEIFLMQLARPQKTRT
ncbi:DNA polymerase III subunit delta [Bacillus sp. FJAT-42376]|uniref:DNA polymerase III subunit delta n=1 Tax=Bacillus sp. FJAT-42376 TaxID=2014076 RepID=UPI000F514FC2|nr:DNA polymerase III subunit delta [Bacillus sp. FJAT-42376]AZB43689.1 DNA polymerase III subunit delta [Bacillus sp. FJAT-42376]